MKKFPIILALLAIAAGCAKEPVVTPVEEGELVTYSLTASLPDAQVKATISDAGKFNWSAGDEIAVYNSATGSFVTFRSAAGDGNFTADAAPGAVFTTAYYPASIAVPSDPDKVNLPTAYTQAEAVAGKSFPMKATVSGSTLEFDHLAALLKLTINDVPEQATSLVLSSAKALGGTFTVGTDGSGDDAILASDGDGDVEITLSNTVRSNISVYVPVPVGTYSYTLSLGNGTVTWLTKSTTSAKTLERGSLHILKALTFVPSTDKGLIGNFNSWDTASVVPFTAVDGQWGWFKASVSNPSFLLNFKLFANDQYTGTPLDPGDTGEDGKRSIVGTVIPIAADGAGHNLTVYTNRAALDVYYNPLDGRLFTLPAGAAFQIPTTAAGEDIDTYALIGYHQTDSWTADIFLEAVYGQNEWRMTTIGTAGDNPHFSIKFRQNGQWANQIGGVYLYNRAANTRYFTKLSNYCDIDIYPGSAGNYDVYVKSDKSAVFVLPAGTSFSVPERVESEDLVGILKIIGGLNNHNWDQSFDLEFVSSTNHDWYVLKNASKLDSNGQIVFKIWNGGWGKGINVGLSWAQNPDNLSFKGNLNTRIPLWLRDSDDEIPNIHIDSGTGQVDIYIKADLSQVFALPAGTAFSVPE